MSSRGVPSGRSASGGAAGGRDDSDARWCRPGLLHGLRTCAVTTGCRTDAGPEGDRGTIATPLILVPRFGRTATSNGTEGALQDKARGPARALRVRSVLYPRLQTL